MVSRSHRGLRGSKAALVGALTWLAGCGAFAEPVGRQPGEALGVDAGEGERPADGGSLLKPDGAPDDPPPADAGTAAPACVEGDRRALDPASGTCYLWFASAVTWQDARAACEGLGAHLAVATSAAENALMDIGVDDPASDLEDSWIGGNDIEAGGEFVWITGETFAFDNFRDGEPNGGGGTGVDEDCVIIEADNGGTWDDRACGDPYPYLCERAP